jgi:hypothetical protein
MRSPGRELRQWTQIGAGTTHGPNGGMAESLDEAIRRQLVCRDYVSEINILMHFAIGRSRRYATNLLPFASTEGNAVCLRGTAGQARHDVAS